MILPSDFNAFLQEIRPTKAMRDQLINGHKTLRERLNADADLRPIVISDFLQGSYRRYTAVRPKGDKRSDVDIIIVTKIEENEYSPKTRSLSLSRFSTITTKASGIAKVARLGLR
jgi:tRNA nucleotidyltransferase (CCA-adding enzyme)